MANYTEPAFEETAFNCPHCQAYAEQKWYQVHASGKIIPTSGHVDVMQRATAMPKDVYGPLIGWTATKCAYCTKHTVWHNGAMFYPTNGSFPAPHADMPADVAKDYLEAGAVLNTSPRSAGALIRLALQRLCAHLGATDNNLNAAILSLQKNGVFTQQLVDLTDIIRKSGNNAVHPGHMSDNDIAGVSTECFNLLNLLVDATITAPAKVNAMLQIVNKPHKP